ncbi:MAG: hypothetical protein WC099_01715 [Candidatus Paceibacterota bacterium]
MSWLKINWFKLSIVFIGIFIVIGIFLNREKNIHPSLLNEGVKENLISLDKNVPTTTENSSPNIVVIQKETDINKEKTAPQYFQENKATSSPVKIDSFYAKVYKYSVNETGYTFLIEVSDQSKDYLKGLKGVLEYSLGEIVRTRLIIDTEDNFNTQEITRNSGIISFFIENNILPNSISGAQNTNFVIFYGGKKYTVPLINYFNLTIISKCDQLIKEMYTEEAKRFYQGTFNENKCNESLIYKNFWF